MIVSVSYVMRTAFGTSANKNIVHLGDVRIVKRLELTMMNHRRPNVESKIGVDAHKPQWYVIA